VAEGPFRDDESAVAKAHATLREAEAQARIVRRGPWLAFGGAYVAVALTIGFIALLAFLLGR